MTSWIGKWDEVSFLGFLEREKDDISRRLCKGSLAAREMASAQAQELREFIRLLLAIREPNEHLRNVDLVIDAAIQLKAVSHGSYKAYYLIFESKRLFYGAVVMRGDEDGLVARLTELAAVLSKPDQTASPAGNQGKS